MLLLKCSSSPEYAIYNCFSVILSPTHLVCTNIVGVRDADRHCGLECQFLVTGGVLTLGL